ncbi:MAG: hypothetical protein ACK4SA_14125 [Caldilinea sp.]
MHLCCRSSVSAPWRRLVILTPDLNLREYEATGDAPEIDEFLRYATEVPNTPEKIASTTTTVE